MPDQIHILSDAVANQIAAGEVVQRPASVVKELLENAVDAGATEIRLSFKEGGKSFIQVSDNGKGMTETDARMCFERHATSKIKTSEDIFSITTKGFRGEALASVAAVAKVNLKTRRRDDPHGTQVEVEASEVVLYEPCSCPEGAVFTVKSLFYNVPARRKFLKSDPVETRHIIDEFQRVALAHPEISFELLNNGAIVYQLPATTFHQRVIGIFGANYKERLVPVEENDTDLLKVNGFLVKPEFSRKTRGEQFFFVNNRFIKSPYLHHALADAFEGLLTPDAYPGYFLLLEIAPDRMDINIHPTKTEVKFEDEKYVYAILKSAVRKSLGKYHITPSLDFEQEAAFMFSPLKSIGEIKKPSIDVDPNYNPFHQSQQHTGSNGLPNNTQKTKGQDEYFPPEQAGRQELWKEEEQQEEFRFFQLQNRYLVARSRSGILVIDQHRAHERVLYEKFLEQWQERSSSSQMELFPHTIELNAADFQVMVELMEDLSGMGFDIEVFGSSAILVRGIPVDAVGQDIPKMIESIIEMFSRTASASHTEKAEVLARILSSRMAVRPGMVLNKWEARQLVIDLFACKMPQLAPNGKPAMLTMDMDELDQKFLKG